MTMLTTFRSIETNAKPVVKRDQDRPSALFLVGLRLVLLLAVAVAIALPAVVTTDNADATWLIGP